MHDTWNIHVQEELCLDAASYSYVLKFGEWFSRKISYTRPKAAEMMYLPRFRRAVYSRVLSVSFVRKSSLPSREVDSRTTVPTNFVAEKPHMVRSIRESAFVTNEASSGNEIAIFF